jgi:hypothetical protein
MNARRFTAGLAVLLAAAALQACGTSDPRAAYGECPAPAQGTGSTLQPITGTKPVIYGTSAPWFTGPLQPAPVAVSLAAGQQLVVCP